MSGIFTSKTLSAGYLSGATPVILYQTPSANTGYLKNFTVTGNSASPIQVTLSKNLSGVIYPWYSFTLNLGDTADVLENETLTLTANDSILGSINISALNGGAFSIHGVEER